VSAALIFFRQATEISYQWRIFSRNHPPLFWYLCWHVNDLYAPRILMLRSYALRFRFAQISSVLYTHTKDIFLHCTIFIILTLLA
jgi:hypothetical protein